MKKANPETKQGFTIIEVVLVLAIAGLIFLMVFVALPSLQRSQRDTQRRQDMARLITAVQNYQAGNKNKIPYTTADGKATLNSNFVSNYLQTNGDTFDDPSSGATYDLATTAKVCTSGTDGCKNDTAATDAMGVIKAYVNATCDGENPKYASGANRVAFTINLEGAGFYCTNN